MLVEPLKWVLGVVFNFSCLSFFLVFSFVKVIDRDLASIDLEDSFEFEQKNGSKYLSFWESLIKIFYSLERASISLIYLIWQWNNWKKVIWLGFMWSESYLLFWDFIVCLPLIICSVNFFFLCLLNNSFYLVYVVWNFFNFFRRLRSYIIHD